MDRKHTNFLIILSISLAMFMSALDGTIVNIALPTISESFHLSSSVVSWVATAYLLVMAGCVLIFGKVSDMIGFKRVFLVGFTIFTLGSLTCGLLPDLLNSFYSLVGSRIFQAIGGAMLAAIAPAMIAAYIPMEEKGKAMGIIMTMAALGTAIGPTIGGVLTQYLSWHWIFFINVPVGILAVILGAKVIPSSGSGAKIINFDSLGGVLIFSGLASLLFAFSEGQTLGWTSPVIIFFLALSLVTLGSFVVHELRTADPILELHLFRSKNFLVLNLILILLYFSFSGINYLLPFYLEYVMKYDTSTAGLVLTSLSFAMMISGLVAGLLYNRVGGKILCLGAGIVLTIGYYLETLLRVDTTMSFVIVSLTCIGFGLGLMMTPISSMIMNSVSKRYGGMVSSLTSLERFAPLTIGIAIFNVIFIEGILRIAARHEVTEAAPVTIKLQVLSAGFDHAFFFSFILGIVLLVLVLIAKEETHPDYQDKQPTTR